MSKTMEQMIGEMRSPEHMIREAKYQNARDAVAWAYKIAQDKVSSYSPSVEGADGVWAGHDPLSAEDYVANIYKYADALIPIIESHLNDTLEALKEPNEAKST